jgi:hypothetical protein
MKRQVAAYLNRLSACGARLAIVALSVHRRLVSEPSDEGSGSPRNRPRRVVNYAELRRLALRADRAALDK